MCMFLLLRCEIKNELYLLCLISALHALNVLHVLAHIITYN